MAGDAVMAASYQFLAQPPTLVSTGAPSIAGTILEPVTGLPLGSLPASLGV
jgi:hypothetical protein